MKTSEVLSAALALIDTPEKWCQGAGRIGGARCAIVAITHASVQSRPSQKEARNAIRDAIGFDSIMDWNDAPERTHADVVSAFQRAIAAEQAKEAAP